jgi:hypothetical protein
MNTNSIMDDINLHKIFRYLLGNENFLSTVIETNQNEPENKQKSNKGFQLMTQMITDYSPLAPYETQEYSLFPSKVKTFLTPDYVRLGIKNVMDKNSNIINVSFLNSLNMLMRPDLHKLNLDDHMKNLNLLENFIVHKISRAYQIDKIKRTKKVQTQNKKLISNMIQGKISHELIQYIVNIFEINLVIFDLTKLDIYLYWTCGTKYPFFNFFRDIYFMAFIQGNYEPIIPLDTEISRETMNKLYVTLLTNINDVKCIPEFNISPNSLLYIDTWNLPDFTYVNIIGKFFNKSEKNADKCFDEYAKLFGK